MASYYQNNEQSNGNSRDPFRSTSGQSLPPDRMNEFDDEDSNGSRRIMPSGLGVAANNFLRFCSAVSVLAAVSIGLILILQILCLASITQFSGPRGCYLFVYRLYGIIFAVVAFCCEMEWTEIIRTTTLLQYWSTRGLFYIFIALFTLQEYAELQWSFPVLQNVVASVGFSLLILGCIYTLMGLLCSKQIRDQKMARYIQMLSLYEVRATVPTLITLVFMYYINSGYSDSYIVRSNVQPAFED